MFDFIPKALIIAALTQASCQVFKVIFYSLKEKSFQLKYLVTYGGMPSAHSAFVTSLTAAVGVLEGPGSSAFAMSFVFALIVIYDAVKLRGAVQAQARVINQLQEKVLGKDQPKLNEMLGHTVPEIFAGVGLALAVGIPGALVLKTFF